MTSAEETTDSVPDITEVLPVYPSAEAEESVWVSCGLTWDEETEAFVSTDERDHSEWIVDDHAWPDAVWHVDGDDAEYSSLEAAMAAALGNRYDPETTYL